MCLVAIVMRELLNWREFWANKPHPLLLHPLLLLVAQDEVVAHRRLDKGLMLRTFAHPMLEFTATALSGSIKKWVIRLLMAY
jgi:hypothetical protein